MDSQTLLKLCQLRGERFVRAEQFPEPNESPDDVDAHLDCGGAVQDVSGLDGSVLGENKWQIAATAATDDL